MFRITIALLVSMAFAQRPSERSIIIMTMSNAKHRIMFRDSTMIVASSSKIDTAQFLDCAALAMCKTVLFVDRKRKVKKEVK